MISGHLSVTADCGKNIKVLIKSRLEINRSKRLRYA